MLVYLVWQITCFLQAGVLLGRNIMLWTCRYGMQVEKNLTDPGENLKKKKKKKKRTSRSKAVVDLRERKRAP